MLPLVSGINSRLPSVNHTLISPILHHPVVWVALPQSVPSTHHFHHPLFLHYFTPGLKPSFSANPSYRTPTFSSSGLTPRIPRTVYRYFWASVYFFQSSCSPLLLFRVVYVGFPAHAKIASRSRIVSYSFKARLDKFWLVYIKKLNLISEPAWLEPETGQDR